MAVAPPGPLFGEGEPPVGLDAAFRATDHDEIGAPTVGRRVRHSVSLRLMCSARERNEVATGVEGPAAFGATLTLR